MGLYIIPCTWLLSMECLKWTHLFNDCINYKILILLFINFCLAFNQQVKSWFLINKHVFQYFGFLGKLEVGVHQQLKLFIWVWIKGCFVAAFMLMFWKSLLIGSLSTTIDVENILFPFWCSITILRYCLDNDDWLETQQFELVACPTQRHPKKKNLDK